MRKVLLAALLGVLSMFAFGTAVASAATVSASPSGAFTATASAALLGQLSLGDDATGISVNCDVSLVGSMLSSNTGTLGTPGIRAGSITGGTASNCDNGSASVGAGTIYVNAVNSASDIDITIDNQSFLLDLGFVSRCSYVVDATANFDGSLITVTSTSLVSSTNLGSLYCAAAPFFAGTFALSGAPYRITLAP